MRTLKLLTVIAVSSFLQYACSGSSSAAKSKDATTTESASADATSTSSDGSFSLKIDAVPVSGGATNELQLQNTAFIYPPKGNVPQTVLFDLMSNKNGDDFYTLRFSLPYKEGEYHATPDNYNQVHTSVTLDFDLKSANNFSRYNADSFTVVINKITSSRISGTFSGMLKLSADTRSQAYKNKVNITDGKFDIPFSTGNLRPE